VEEFIKKEHKIIPPEKQIEVKIDRRFENGIYVSAWTPLAKVGQQFEVDAYIIDEKHHGHLGKATVEYDSAHAFQIRDLEKEQYFVSIPYIRAARWERGGVK